MDYKSKLYFTIALLVIIALNMLAISRIIFLQEIIEQLNDTISKIPELSEPIIIER